MNKKTVFKTAMYMRLSREDTNSLESNSISNQKQLIRNYIKNKNDIELVLEVSDDGVSGANFNRDGFLKLMEEIKKGNINCVIVKDLSRFGRNYIEVGDYIEKIFPFLGVRFISINDDYDSINENSRVNDILIPFKNLINESYVRDTSLKIKSQFKVKRENGEYIGAFCPYGFKKDKNDKNKLVVDEYAKSVIIDIFKLKVKGFSNKKIVDTLNLVGEFSPYEYKKLNNENFKTSFNKTNNFKWQENMVTRILNNEIYNGTLIQGKVTTKNYKTKQVVKNDKKNLCIVKNNHTKIVSDSLFNIVQKLLLLDTRVSPKKDVLYLFSSILYCGDCKSVMCRKTISSLNKKYYYFVCSNNKLYKTCSTHSFKEDKMYSLIYAILHKYILNILPNNTYETIYMNNSKSHNNKLLTIKNNELSRVSKYNALLYEDFKDNVLTQSEYINYKNFYSNKKDRLLKEIDNLKDLLNKDIEISPLELNRSLLVFLIDKIEVFNKNNICITFNFKNIKG